MFEGTSENVTANSLKGIRSAVDSTLRPYSTLIGHNLGNAGLIATVPMHQFYGMSAVANEIGLTEAGFEGQPVAQRKLNPKHALGLAVYMLRGLLETLYTELSEGNKPVSADLQQIRKEMGHQPYFALQPIVANIRTCGVSGDGLKFEEISPGYVKVYLSDRDVLWVVDGQHRRYGMDMLFDFLDSVLKNHAYPKRGNALYRPLDGTDITPGQLSVWKSIFELARTKCTILLDLHLGLNADQERQLFHDLNNLGKRVEASLAFQFDTSNPVNLFIKEELIDKGVVKVIDKDKPDWHDDDGAIARKDLVAINARLILNKTTVSGAKPQDVLDKVDMAREFWEAVTGIPFFGDPGAKAKTVSAQPVVLKALAKLAHDFGFGREKNRDLLDRLFQGIDEIDFTHSNPMWRYYELDAPELANYGLAGLAEYLPPSGQGANRDLGTWSSTDNWMRFGAKSNDIYPIVGDMIRWKLGLPNRQKRRAEAEVPTVEVATA